MSVHEDLLNNGENNCSFTEDEVDIMCSKDGDDACRVGCLGVKEIKSSARKRRISGLFRKLGCKPRHLKKLGYFIWKHIYRKICVRL